VTAPDQCCRNVRKFLPRRRPHVTQSEHRVDVAKLTLLTQAVILAASVDIDFGLANHASGVGSKAAHGN
jgi:hypothetical protein